MSVLVGVLVVVAVVAWACSSGSSGPQRASSAQSSPTASAADPLLAGLSTLAMGTPSPTPTPTPTPTKPRPSPAPAAKPKRPGEPCEPGDLVLNMSGGQDVYAAGAKPTFMITLVNTGSVMCTADVGPQALEMRITSGKDRIWSTSDCVSGNVTDIKQLQRGIPYVRSVDWDRRRSSTDCSDDRRAALPGTYVAVVRMGKLKTPMGVFHLR
ncbi:hypothetical protein [Nonomuraea sediminis]|uniref:hypothetical protein n=1 Tax=Nonomuraea sediminis TaxID=2835864 RepID=UPI002029E819|nr:hypothetical protein [Nonomuraea sediminis]